MTSSTAPLTAAVGDWPENPGFAGVERITYPIDTGEDWALAWPGTRDAWVVAIHGHGSRGDQLFTRVDVRDAWLAAYRELGLGILSPNLRGNGWMCPAVANDLHRLLAWARNRYGIAATLFLSGSMGGTSNLIYGTLFPEDITAMSALCSATDVGRYAGWCREHPGSVRDEIYQAIISAYGGTPEEAPAHYAAHSAELHAGRLTMPLLISHGDADEIIPIEESRRLVEAMHGASNLTYREIPGGDHDSPLFRCDLVGWLKSIL